LEVQSINSLFISFIVVDKYITTIKS